MQLLQTHYISTLTIVQQSTDNTRQGKTVEDYLTLRIKLNMRDRDQNIYVIVKPCAMSSVLGLLSKNLDNVAKLLICYVQRGLILCLSQ